MPTLLPSGSYRARVRIAGVQHELGTFPTEDDAKYAELDFKRNLPKQVDRHTAAKLKPRTFHQWAETVMKMKEAANLSPGTIRNQRGILKNYCYPHFGDQLITDITKEQVRDWYINDLPNSPGRTNVYRTLSSVFAYAVEEGYIEATPCRVPDKKKASAKKPLLKPEDVERLLQLMRPEVRVVAIIQWGGALRIGEVLGLDLDDVDLESGRVHVHKQLSVRDGLVDHTKTKRDRTVKLPQFALEAARIYRQENPRFGSEMAFFTGMDGKRISRRIVERDVAKAAKESGLTWFTSHQLRHSMITLFAQTPGVTLRDIMDFSGHSTVAMVLRYEHTDEERRDLLVDRLNDVLAPKTNSYAKITRIRKSA